MALTPARLTLALVLVFTHALGAQPPASSQIIARMVANEDAAAKHRDHFAYLSNERSDRTGGHLWTERVVETTPGKIRFLIAEDGHPLPPDREAAERGRLAQIVADPDAFARRSQAQKDDDTHAKQMLDVLPAGFLFGPAQPEGPDLRIDFRPNPGYHPNSMEERLLHGMSGTVWVDAKALRLHRLQGRLPEDMNIGFGLLATIKAGSNFSTERQDESPADSANGGNLDQWKTVRIDSAINGRAILFKTIARNQQTVRTDFHRIPYDLPVAQAVAQAEQ